MTVSCSSEFAERCRIAAEPTDALVLECEHRGVRALSLRWRPLALILTTDLYRADPDTYESIARRCRAKLIIVGDETAATSELKRQIILAVRAAYR